MSLVERMAVAPSLSWLSEMNKLFEGTKINVPTDYTEQVVSVKEILRNDVTGLVNTILDFAINCSTVDYYVESKNINLGELLNKWMYSINDSLRGKIPVGIKALAKEYFRERWKSGSLIVMRTIWEKVGDYILPTKMWFVDGEYLDVKDEGETRRLGEEKYSVIVGNKSDNKRINLPAKKDERIFVQKPFSSWGELKPTPFVIQRGIYKNAKMLELLEEKGENLISKAIEYLMMIKKGTEKMALTENPDFIYSADDLEKVKTDLSDFLAKGKSGVGGVPVYATNFDTEVEHLIPEYKRILEKELYAPIEKRILGGLGFIDVVEGVSFSRKESILNPKPFVQEVHNGIEDFKTLFRDIIDTIVEVNKSSHKKYFTEDMYIEVHNSPVTAFFDKEVRLLLRSMYDRGVLSKRTFTEVVGEVDFDIEVERRKKETSDNLDEVMEPPVIQNNGEDINSIPVSEENDNENENKKGPESKNFQSASEEKLEQYNFELAVVVRKKDGWHVLSKDGKNLGGPYKTKKEALKRLKQVEYYKHKGNSDLSNIKKIMELEILDGKKKLLGKILGETLDKLNEEK